MAVDSWDVLPLTLVIENYFTDENSEKTIVGIWEDVYYGMTDCYIGGEKVFDCLNIVRSMYLYLGSKRLAAHNIPEFWEQLRSSKFLDRWERETVFSALYYILFKTGKDQRLCDQVRKLVDYDRPIGDDAPFDTFHDLIQKNDSKSSDGSKSHEEDLIEFYNSPEGQAEVAEYMANSPSIEDIERWMRGEEREDRKNHFTFFNENTQMQQDELFTICQTTGKPVNVINKLLEFHKSKIINTYNCNKKQAFEQLQAAGMKYSQSNFYKVLNNHNAGHLFQGDLNSNESNG